VSYHFVAPTIVGLYALILYLSNASVDSLNVCFDSQAMICLQARDPLHPVVVETVAYYSGIGCFWRSVNVSVAGIIGG